MRIYLIVMCILVIVIFGSLGWVIYDNITGEIKETPGIVIEKNTHTETTYNNGITEQVYETGFRCLTTGEIVISSRRSVYYNFKKDDKVILTWKKGELGNYFVSAKVLQENNK